MNEIDWHVVILTKYYVLFCKIIVFLEIIIFHSLFLSEPRYFRVRTNILTVSKYTYVFWFGKTKVKSKEMIHESHSILD